MEIISDNYNVNNKYLLELITFFEENFVEGEYFMYISPIRQESIVLNAQKIELKLCEYINLLLSTYVNSRYMGFCVPSYAKLVFMYAKNSFDLTR
jgi:hypothetical protein